MSLGGSSRWRRRKPVGAGADVHAIARRGAATARFLALAEIARVSWASTDDDLLLSLAEAARRALDAATVSLSVWEPDRGRVRTLANVGELGPTESAQPESEYYSLDDYGPLDMLLEAHIGWVADVDSYPPDHPSVRLLLELGKHSGLSVPIPGQGRVWGELYATRRADQPALTEDDLQFGVAVGAQVGAALVTAEHLRRAEGQQHLDPVTGLAGRRHVDDQLELVMNTWHSDGAPASLVLVDIDGLGDLMTTDGRSTAEQVLRRCAGLMSTAAARLPGSVAGRYDWDRLCLVASGPAADDVVAAAEQLVRDARQLLPVRVVCGVASTGDLDQVVDRGVLLRLVEAAQGRARAADGLVPVVAGRALPALGRMTVAAQRAELSTRSPSVGTGAMKPGPTLVGGSLTLGGADPTGRLLRLSLDLLDDAGAEVLDRLVALASLFCQHVDGLGWWVSSVEGDRIRTRQFARHRLTQEMSTGIEEWDDAGYLASDYPESARVMREGGWLCIEAGDPAADPSELAMLDGMGAASLVAAGGPDASGQGWLVEVYSDALSRPQCDVLTVLRAVVPHALHP